MDGSEGTSVVGTEGTEGVVTTPAVEGTTATTVETPAVETTTETTAEESKTFTEEDVQRIVQERLSREKATQVEREEEAKKVAKMNATEKLQHQLDKQANLITELQNEKTIAGLKSTASTLLAESGVTATDELLSILVTTDADSTNANLKTFVDIVNAKADELLQQKLKGTAPKVVTSAVSQGTTMTRAEILAIPDIEERQSMIEKNINLFE